MLRLDNAVSIKINKPNAGSGKLAPRSRSFREVFVNFLWFSYVFESFRACSDLFGCIRMRSDAFRCVRMHSDTSGNFRMFGICLDGCDDFYTFF